MLIFFNTHPPNILWSKKALILLRDITAMGMNWQFNLMLLTILFALVRVLRTGAFCVFAYIVVARRPFNSLSRSPRNELKGDAI